MKLKLDKETRKRLRIKKRAEKAGDRLGSGESLTIEQRTSLKHVMAKGLREFPTPAENKIKPLMQRFGFEHNPVIFGFIPDFANRRHKVIVEIDGSIHRKPEVRAKDKEKNEAFRRNGWIVLRFRNDVVFEREDIVLASVLAALK